MLDGCQVPFSCSCYHFYLLFLPLDFSLDLLPAVLSDVESDEIGVQLLLDDCDFVLTIFLWWRTCAKSLQARLVELILVCLTLRLAQKALEVC